MIATKAEMISQSEVDFPLCEKVDEVQNTLCESGKNFESMNMDEFLSSIWTAEQKQAQAQSTNSIPVVNDIAMTTHRKGFVKKSSSSRTIPGPILASKTPEEVWAEIRRTRQDQEQNSSNTTQQRQLTFGVMTLEDFLVRAGVGFEQSQPPPMPIQQQPYKMGTSNFAPCQRMPQPAAVGEMSSTYPKAIQRGGGYPNQGGPSVPSCFVETIGYGQVKPLGGASPVMSPVSPGGLCNQLADGTNIPYEMDIGGGRKKGIIDGPIERVVDRRRRRMIKNRESAARSRARKHAYTIELEAELNQVKEENAHLKQVLTEMERERRQEQMVEMKVKSMADCKCCKELPLSHSDKSPYLKDYDTCTAYT